MRVVKTRHGIRMEEGGCVLSEIRRHPGPTHSLFDVLAATIAALSSGPRVAMLGFAGGGLIAPLRAMGCWHAIHGVDLSTRGESIFRDLCGLWCGDVTLDEGDAAQWLRAQDTPFDLVLEDLSANVDGELTKPAVSLGALPDLMASKLMPAGVCVTNVLPVPGIPWTDLLHDLRAPYAHAVVLTLDLWENRVLICAHHPLAARTVGRRVRHELQVISSQEQHGMRVRTLPTS